MEELYLHLPIRLHPPYFVPKHLNFATASKALTAILYYNFFCTLVPEQKNIGLRCYFRV
jgi:hypothetical protein